MADMTEMTKTQKSSTDASQKGDAVSYGTSY